MLIYFPGHFSNSTQLQQCNFKSLGKWQPTPVFLPGESQGRGSLVGYRLWGCTESDTTEVTAAAAAAGIRLTQL